VTEATTIPDCRPVTIGPGRLILVVGPSGAGKDTLLELARAACADDGSIVFPRRVVTREASSFEENEPVSLDAFRQALARGEFAMHWEAHGHCYGLRRAVEDDVSAGRTVIANVSRTVIGAMRRAYANVVVVSITAPAEILAARLTMRSRSSDGKVEDRIRRTVDDAASAPDVIISNVGSADANASKLVRIIKG
jgi:ribose 1,5-bisphosphokinase